LYNSDRHNPSIDVLQSRREKSNRERMKRPIAELLSMTVNADVESTQSQYEHEAWQILRRKQGYVTHRLYRGLAEPLQRLVYSEWESKKALDGARQHLQGTPLQRRARAALSVAPQRLLVELGGPVTSTKGLDLPSGAVACTALIRLAKQGEPPHGAEEKLWKVLSSQAGHLATVVFHGFEDRLLLGWLSHWADAELFEKARTHFEEIASGAAAAQPAGPLQCTAYAQLSD
jgi:heme-degrading monooxygenase HmoA